MLRLIKSIKIPSKFLFSTRKTKGTAPLSVSRFKLDQKINGQLIYQTNKMKSFGLVGLAICGGVVLSLIIALNKATVGNLISLGVCLGALIGYQRRISKTLKQVIVEKSGQNIRIITYGIFGTPLFQGYGTIPTFIIRGVHHKKLTKGIVIRGGGYYYFHENGVIDKLVFDTVMSGNSIKYVDKLDRH